MAKINLNFHDGLKAQGGDKPKQKDPNTLELTVNDIAGGISYEKACFRHLSKPAIEQAKKFKKTVIVHQGHRKVVMKDGGSTKPYYESEKGQRLRWAIEED